MLGKNSSGREQLLGGVDPLAAAQPLPGPTYNQNDAGERGLAQLQETQRIANETENLGMNILTQLGQQRNQLESAAETRREAHEGLSISSRLIRQMHRRATWMKMSFAAVIVLLVVGIGLIVYFKWGNNHHDPPPPSAPKRALLDDELAVGAVVSQLADHLQGRALQTANATFPPPPPLPPLPSPPPPRPPALAPFQRSGIGAGLIIIMVVTSISLLACLLSIPRGLVIRTVVFIVGFLLCLATFLFLFLMPRAPPAGIAVDERLTDASFILRILLLIIASIFALVGGVFLLLLGAMAPQKAPVVSETEHVELYREAKMMQPVTP